MPPKKAGTAGKNAFFYFMSELKERQGKNIKSMREAADVAGPLWNNMSAKEREPYERMAGRGKQNQAEVKFTSLGTSIAQVEKEEKDLKHREMQIRQDTLRTVKMLVQTEKAATYLFYIIHINNFCYCNATKRHYPAEIAVSRFSLLDGTDSDKVFHRLVKPGSLPLGYMYEARRISDETHQLPAPEAQGAPNNTEEIFNDLLAFLTEIHPDRKELPTLYAREKELAVVLDVLRTFATDAGQDEVKIAVHPLEYLLFCLKNAVADEQVWPAFSLSANEIDRDVYDFTTEIACEYHEQIGVPVYCSKAIVTRLAYIICDNCCKYLGIDLVPGRHVPNNAKLATVPRSNTASYASSVVDDEAAGYKLNALSESDYGGSTLSFVSAVTELDDDDFPAIGSSRKHKQTDSYSTNSSGWGPPRSRPVELPSALTNRMEGLSLQQSQKPKGRGRGIFNKANKQ